MSHAQAHNQPHAYDPSDPHGFHEEGHHGHVIVPWQILLGVLLALLAFTVLTVFQAQFEKYAAVPNNIADEIIAKAKGE